MRSQNQDIVENRKDSHVWFAIYVVMFMLNYLTYILNDFRLQDNYYLFPYYL